MKSSKEIIDSLLRKKTAERMGLFELVWGDTLKMWTRQGYPLDDQGNPVDACDHFDYDMDMAGDWWDILPIRGYEEIVEESDLWHVKRNGAGASLKYWKQKSGTPEHVAFEMTSRDVWEKKYRKYLLELDPARIKMDFIRKRLEIRRRQGRWTFFGHMFVFENLRQSVGDICLYESVLLDPDWIHDYNRVYTDFFKKHYKYMFENAGVPDGIWVYEDLGYKNTTFCDPKVYENLFFPYYAELIEFFHSYNLPVVLHSCGFIEEIIPQVIDLGFTGLNPMEIKAGCDPLRLAQKYAEKLTFIGGLDVRILESRDRGLIKSEVTKLTKGMKDRGASYIFASDHSISSEVNYLDYQYALEIFRENCFY